MTTDDVTKAMRRIFPNANDEELDMLLSLFDQYIEAVDKHESGKSDS